MKYIIRLLRLIRAIIATMAGIIFLMTFILISPFLSGVGYILTGNREHFAELANIALEKISKYTEL